LKLLQATVGALFFIIIFLLPFILNLFSVVFESYIHHSFAHRMQAVEEIDYKALYEGALVSIEALTQQMAQLKKMIFGSKHERYIPTDNTSSQLTLELDAATIAACKITSATKISYTRTTTEVTFNKPKPHPGRMKLPENLRRETVVLLPDFDITGLKKIGEEITEILDLVPGELFVKQYIRPKFVKSLSETSNTVITASLPGRMMEKCMAGEGLVAQITVDKYMDHLSIAPPVTTLCKSRVDYCSKHH
jgi:transposase